MFKRCEQSICGAYNMFQVKIFTTAKYTTTNVRMIEVLFENVFYRDSYWFLYGFYFLISQIETKNQNTCKRFWNVSFPFHSDMMANRRNETKRDADDSQTDD